MLTGKIRYRTTWRKKLILQVQVNGKIIENTGASIDVTDGTKWRDAEIEDLTIKEEEV